MISFRKNRLNILNLTSLLLFVVFVISIVSHTIFSVGLNYDGVNDLNNIIFYNSFDLFEKSRLFFHSLYQMPAWLFIKFFPSDSLSLLTMVFSFGLVWIHIFSILGCWLILPKDKKNYIFFPLFAFLVGPLTSLDHSVSVSLSVFSYVWLTTFTVYYSDLSLRKHKLLFLIIPFPLLLGHELMSYTSLFLIFLCFLKIRQQQKIIINKIIITSLTLFFIITCFIAAYFILFPPIPLNRDSFLSGLFSFGFLYKEKTFHLYIISALILIIIPFIQFFYFFLLKRFFLIFFCSLSLMIDFILLTPNSNFLYHISPHHLYPYAFNFNKVWVCLVLPFTLLLWFLFEKKKINFNNQRVFLILCFLTSISLIKWRVEMDHNFYKFQKQFSENLKSYEGVLEGKISKNFYFFPESFYIFHEPFVLASFLDSASLIFPRSREVKAIMLDPIPQDCLIACEKNQRLDIYNSLDNSSVSKNKRLSYCEQTCLLYRNQKFKERLSTVNTRFFDFTYLKKYF